MCQYCQVNSWLYCTAFVLQMKTMIADDMLSKTIRTPLLFATQCVLDISRSFFFVYNSQKTPTP